MKIPTSFLLTVLFVFITQNSALWGVHANDDEKTDINDKQIKDPNTADETECSNLADFYYEIVMGVTSFPKQGDCSIEEEAEIASFLQDKINTYLGTLPGTIGTKNKVCSNPINNHRQLQPASKNNISDAFTHASLRSLKSLLRGSIHPVTTTKEQNVRILHRRRSFIYVGGGKCRFCLNDNSDHRALSPALKDLPIRTTRTTTRETLSNNDRKRTNQKRDLLFLTSAEPAGTTLDEVADVLLCEKIKPFTILTLMNNKLPTDWIQWRNAKLTVFLDMQGKGALKMLVGRYVPGEGLSIQADMNRLVQIQKKNENYYNIQHYGKEVKMAKLPVKEGTVRFDLYAFDLPHDISTEILADDPIYLFINGIKLDLSLLISQRGVKRKQLPYAEVFVGRTFAGITWAVKRSTLRLGKNFAHGPEPDTMYTIEIKAPSVILDHKNQLDIDFMIKPNAKAKHYGFSDIEAKLIAVECKVTDLENSPFEDFKSVVESRLFHKLGIDLAREFQGKEGHCFYEKIPVVNVNLVEKEDWKNSNPQCGQ